MDLRAATVFSSCANADKLALSAPWPLSEESAAVSVAALWFASVPVPLLGAEVSVVEATALVLRVAGGVTLETSFMINWSIRSSPSFFRNVLLTLTTTASMGMSARRDAYAKAEARTGQRLREKLRQTNTQKCTKRRHFERCTSCTGAFSSNSACAPARIFSNLESFFTILNQQRYQSPPQSQLLGRCRRCRCCRRCRFGVKVASPKCRFG